MSDLTPTLDFPGLHIVAAPIYRGHDDSARWSTHTDGAPSASYVCGGCGQSDEAAGSDNVKALVDDYTAHHGPAHRGGRS
ncbi:hypothetical protein [Streptomyces sp. NPDC050738]|uniref:hypothetical protein n=1 Tax=Streptomyces sp. NPDC050738 TaxID=3154744 RepID=UPI00343C590C